MHKNIFITFLTPWLTSYTVAHFFNYLQQNCKHGHGDTFSIHRQQYR